MAARSKDLVLGIVAVAVLVAATSLIPVGELLAAPSGEPLPTMCWIRAATGHECPTCGMSRSFVAFFHGDVGHAFRFHPMGPVLAVGTVLVLISVLALALARREPLWGRPLFVRSASLVAVGALVAGVVRMLVGGLA
jgi:hypothetical protein